jgi:bacillithiol biosynthesis deacetylase BshB1
MKYDIIAIAAHPDDIEVAMGGTVAKLTSKNYRFLIVDICDGEPARYAKFGERRKQAKKAAEILGADLLILDEHDRLIEDSIEIRLKLAQLIRQHQPRWVFATTDGEVHPDHKAITSIAEGAVFYARLPKWEDVPAGEILEDTQPWEIDRLLYYYCRMEPAWNRFDFVMNVSEYYEKKIQAISVYESIFADKQAAMIQRVENADRHFGNLVGVKYAEIFRCRSPLIIDDLSSIGTTLFG